MVRTLPAPSLRELSSECETEGVYFDERKRSKVSEFYMRRWVIIGMEQPSDDTPSVSPCGLPAPSEREPGRGGCHSSNRSETATLRAIFIAPTELRNYHRPETNPPVSTGGALPGGAGHLPYRNQLKA